MKGMAIVVPSFILPGRKYMSSFSNKVIHLSPLAGTPQFCIIALIYILSTKIFAFRVEVCSKEKTRMELNFKLLVKTDF